MKNKRKKDFVYVKFILIIIVIKSGFSEQVISRNMKLMGMMLRRMEERIKNTHHSIWGSSKFFDDDEEKMIQGMLLMIIIKRPSVRFMGKKRDEDQMEEQKVMESHKKNIIKNENSNKRLSLSLCLEFSPLMIDWQVVADTYYLRATWKHVTWQTSHILSLL